MGDGPFQIVRAALARFRESAGSYRPSRVSLAASFIVLTLLAQPFYGTRTSSALGGLAVLLVSYGLIQRLPPRPRRLMLVIATTRFLALFADLLLTFSPQLDSRVYSSQAAHYALLWRGIDYPKYANIDRVQVLVFIGPLIQFFYVFGPSFPLARLFWAGLGLIAPYALYSGLRHLYPQRWAAACALGYGLWPSLVQLQTDVLRDNLVVIAMVGAFALIVRFRARNHWAALAGASCCLALAVLVRQVNLLVVLPFLAYASVFLRPPWLRRAFAAVAVVGTFRVLVDPTLRARFFYLGLRQPNAFESFRRSFGNSRSSYLVDVAFRSWADVILFLPLGLFAFLFVPLPWQFHNLQSLVLAAENAFFYYPIAALAILGVGKMSGGRGRHERMLAWLVLIIMGLAYGLVEANVASAMRHRHQFTWAWFVLLPPGLELARAWLQRAATPRVAQLRNRLARAEAWFLGRRRRASRASDSRLFIPA